MTERQVIERVQVPQMAAPTVWLATPEGLAVIDMVAIERAVNGERRGWGLTEDEARYATRLLLDHGIPYSTIVSRVGVNARTLKNWFPEIQTPDHMARTAPRSTQRPPCGTRRGYGAHKRRGEKACKRCRAANAAADRHYRRFGTHLGAPEVAA
ncbi:hypothetical protein [Streptomyces sp. NPDC087300]|uniref:hypothetical protein n=1 Tax=Streptomyces sp. NPDC087300 TaxID=3365780 RepID=UPI0037F78522